MSEAYAISKALTPAQILARLLTVDGVGSGLDADTVDGWSPSAPPIAPYGAPIAVPLSASPNPPPRNTIVNSLFRN